MAHEIYASLRVELPNPSATPQTYAEVISVITAKWAEFLDEIKAHEPIVTLAVNETGFKPALPNGQPVRKRQARKRPDFVQQPLAPLDKDEAA